MSVYLKLIWAYLKIGLFGFGGGYAMLALIEREVVTPGWITEQMFTDIVAISQMTPGPIGISYHCHCHVALVPAGTLCKSLHSPSQGVGYNQGSVCRVASCRHRTYCIGCAVADEPSELPR